MFLKLLGCLIFILFLLMFVLCGHSAFHLLFFLFLYRLVLTFHLLVFRLAFYEFIQAFYKFFISRDLTFLHHLLFLEFLLSSHQICLLLFIAKFFVFFILFHYIFKILSCYIFSLQFSLSHTNSISLYLSRLNFLHLNKTTILDPPPKNLHKYLHISIISIFHS
jgi:hypothetical protein